MPPFNRRQFLNRFPGGLGGAALAEMLASSAAAAPSAAVDRGILGATHFAPKAKRIIYLFMAGAPSHLELFDNKPALTKYDGTLPPADLHAQMVDAARRCLDGAECGSTECRPGARLAE